MKLADLPPNVQRQVRAGAATVGAVRPAARRSRPTRAAGRTLSHRCETCGHAGTYPNVEAHVDEEHRHGRIALVLDA